jgi:hypothetical protein
MMLIILLSRLERQMLEHRLEDPEAVWSSLTGGCGDETPLGECGSFIGIEAACEGLEEMVKSGRLWASRLTRLETEILFNCVDDSDFLDTHQGGLLGQTHTELAQTFRQLAARLDHDLVVDI